MLISLGPCSHGVSQEHQGSEALLRDGNVFSAISETEDKETYGRIPAFKKLRLYVMQTTFKGRESRAARAAQPTMKTRSGRGQHSGALGHRV